MKIYLGTSGYSYSHWAKGVFYPEGLSPQKWLEFYSEKFNCVELNVTFYRLPKPSVFLGWYQKTPKQFSFVVKGSRFITHLKRLKDVQEPLGRLAERTSLLEEKIKAFLWQFPPGFKQDSQRLFDFCCLLKKKKVFRNSKHIFEFRDQSWFQQSIFDILKDFRFCLCFADPSEGIKNRILTSDVAYLRFHGPSGKYNSNYTKRQLEKWSSFVQSREGQIKILFTFFNNDACGFAVKNAAIFRQLLDRQLMRTREY